MKKWVTLVFILVIFESFNSFADGDFSIGGYYKNFFVLVRQSELGFNSSQGSIGERNLGIVNKQLRLRAKYDFSNWASILTAYSFSPRIQDPSLFSDEIFKGFISSLEYRIEDFKSRLYPKDDDYSGSFGIFQNLDRAFLTFKTSFADFYVGRQAIA